MKDKVFFDTNILVYAYDKHDPAKQHIAKDLLLDHIRKQNGYVSLQVFGEFFNVVTKRIANPLSSEEARQAISHLSILNVVSMDIDLMHRAIDNHQKYQTTYWDSLIIAAAARSNCIKLFSEDFNATQIYDGILLENPFSDLSKS